VGPVNIHDARSRLSQLIETVERGEEVTIAREGQPVARLVPLRRSAPIRLGVLKGMIHVPDDFDAPLPPEVIAAFRGE
jgi:prevent-host-death family protein